MIDKNILYYIYFNKKTKIMETPITIQQISELLDSKLEPVKNDISAIKTDLVAIQSHFKSINERLYKLEERVTKIDLNLDKLASRTTNVI